MPIAHLDDRAIVKVSGADATSFLDGLVTCAVGRITPEAARFGALLTPQGKILFDFLLAAAPEEIGGGYLLECPRIFVPDLAKRLAFYKLRAKVEIVDLSEGLAVIAGWGDARPPEDEVGVVYADPRLPALGWRAAIARVDVAEFATTPAAEYHAHRIALGVPEGGKDYLFTETFPHEALFDQLHGVDFDKGCYVGQEVVSRMQHRGSARTRIVPVAYEDGFVPEPGADVTAGDRVIGKAGTGAQGRGLVMVRLDRLEEAVAEGREVRSGGLRVRFARPAWIGFPVPGVGEAAL